MANHLYENEITFSCSATSKLITHTNIKCAFYVIGIAILLFPFAENWISKNW